VSEESRNTHLMKTPPGGKGSITFKGDGEVNNPLQKKKEIGGDPSLVGRSQPKKMRESVEY